MCKEELFLILEEKNYSYFNEERVFGVENSVSFYIYNFFENFVCWKYVYFSFWFYIIIEVYMVLKFLISMFYNNVLLWINCMCFILNLRVGVIIFVAVVFGEKV